MQQCTNSYNVRVVILKRILPQLFYSIQGKSSLQLLPVRTCLRELLRDSVTDSPVALELRTVDYYILYKHG